MSRSPYHRGVCPPRRSVAVFFASLPKRAAQYGSCFPIARLFGRFLPRSIMATRVPMTGPSTVMSEKMPAVCGLPKAVLAGLAAMMCGKAAACPGRLSGRFRGDNEEVRFRGRGVESRASSCSGLGGGAYAAIAGSNEGNATAARNRGSDSYGGATVRLAGGCGHRTVVTAAWSGGRSMFVVARVRCGWAAFPSLVAAPANQRR